MKELDKQTGCPHVCVLQCHPGPCPPCKAFAPRQPCPCGKKTLVRRCSDKNASLTCGQRCGNLLSCGRHRCEKLCHVGSCSPCKVPVVAGCFCGRKNEVVLCGDMMFEGEIGTGNGVFSCNDKCGRVLGCGNHECLESCHPGPCGECMSSVDKIKKCCCGKTDLKEKRTSCLDPIPTCSSLCEKALKCGVHFCAEKCHEGECPKCLVKVEQKCRCGSSQRTIECYKTVEEEGVFVCEKVCGKKKNCGRHRCSEKCCPLSRPDNGHHLDGEWDPHLCSVPCGKKLRCGQHACQLLCHSGHCPPCLETIFNDLSCACGKTSIPPPLPCGTPVPTCMHPCLIPQPCGHTASHTCHFGDCPPCSVPVSKECMGGHVLLRNVPCGSKDIRCTQQCGKTRQCGLHACARVCHSPPCDPPLPSGSNFGSRISCGQICGAPRRDCKHTCRENCHPSSPCPDTRCEFMVTITCSCGRITANVQCGAGGNGSGFNTDSAAEISRIQSLSVPLLPVELNGKRVPLGQRKLTCDEECEKLARKKQLADAFEINTPNMESLQLGENSSALELLADMFRREPKWVSAVEERFKYLVLGKGKGITATNLRVHVFCPALKEKRDALRYLAERWKLKVQSAGWEPKRFLAVHVTPKSKPPLRIIGSKPGVPVTALHPPAFDPLIDMDPRLVVAMLDLPGDADISALVLRFGGECELLWLNDKNALAVFCDPARAATALRRLDHGTVYQGATVVYQNNNASGSNNNVWGGAVSSNANAISGTHAWKKDSSWGESSAPVWKKKEDSSTIMALDNRWSVLSTEANKHAAVSESVDGSSDIQAGDGSSSLIQATNGEVDSWEEACD